MILAFHKPYDVLSQFTRELPQHRTLADFGFPKGVYPVGRLDRDSEGLLLLGDERAAVDYLLNPRNEHARTYWVQVEGVVDEKALVAMSNGSLVIQGHRCAKALAKEIPEPVLPPRVPPIRHRLTVPTSWMALTLTEGKNRQVRKMTAAVGLPTLRLVRGAIGKLGLGNLAPGEWRSLTDEERKELGLFPQRS